MTTFRPDLPPLKTPLTAPLLGHYPSELRSPAVGTPTYIKREESLRTPITPPAAYLDFLSKLSPTITSPQSAFATSRFFSFEKPPLTHNISSDSITSNSSLSSFSSGSSLATVKTLDSDEAGSPPVEEGRAIDAVLASEPSSDSADSSKAAVQQSSLQTATTEIEAKQQPSVSIKPSSGSAPAPPLQPSTSSSAPAVQPVQPSTSQLCPPPPTPTAASIHALPPPPSPFNRPQSARTPRRLYIPQSPYTPGSVRSPLSATGPLYSPFQATMSPREWESLERVGGIPLSAGGIGSSSSSSSSGAAASSSAVAAATASAAGNAVGNGRAIVRQVITRTVTYATRAPGQAPIVEPVPKWKKRKVGP